MDSVVDSSTMDCLQKQLNYIQQIKLDNEKKNKLIKELETNLDILLHLKEENKNLISEKKKFEKNEQQILSLEKEKEAQKRFIQSIQTENNLKTEKITALIKENERLKECEGELVELSRQLELSKGQIEELKSSSNKNSDQFAQLARIIKEEKEARKSAESLVANLTKKEEGLSLQMEKLKKIEKIAEKLRKENEDLNKTLKNNEDHSEKLSGSIENLQNLTKSLQKEKNDIKNQLDMSKSELKEERGKANQKLIEKEAKIGDILSEFKKLEERYQRLSLELKEKEKEIQNLDNMNKVLLKKEEENKVLISKKDEEIDLKKRLADHHKQEKNKLLEENTRQKMDISNLETSKTKYKKMLDDLNSSLSKSSMKRIENTSPEEKKDQSTVVLTEKPNNNQSRHLKEEPLAKKEILSPQINKKQKSKTTKEKDQKNSENFSFVNMQKTQSTKDSYKLSDDLDSSRELVEKIGEKNRKVHMELIELNSDLKNASLEITGLHNSLVLSSPQKKLRFSKDISNNQMEKI